jgi:hypothetical protein
MIDNQDGRRNLMDGWKYQLKLTKKEELLKIGKENLKIPTGGKNSLTLSTIDKVNHNTRDTIANDLADKQINYSIPNCAVSAVNFSNRYFFTRLYFFNDF